MNAAFALVQKVIDEKINVKEIYVDTVGSATKYEKILSDKFAHHNIKFRVEAKADSLFPCVSAASIVAKVNRDRILKNWKFEEEKFIEKNYDNEKKFSNLLGSGYPGDPRTKKWMAENFDPVFGYPNVVRFSWSTTSNCLQQYGVYPAIW